MKLYAAITLLRPRDEVPRFWQDSALHPGYLDEVDARVRFDPAPADRGTEIHVSIQHDAPGGRVGEVVDRVRGAMPFDQRPAQPLQEGELAEVVVSEGQGVFGPQHGPGARHLCPGNLLHLGAGRMTRWKTGSLHHDERRPAVGPRPSHSETRRLSLSRVHGRVRLTAVRPPEDRRLGRPRWLALDTVRCTDSTADLEVQP